MKVEIAVALTAAFSALLVSFLTGINQLLQIRANHRLERKKDLEHHAQSLSDEYFSETQEGLREACKALQRFQDAILILVKAAPDSLISENHQEQLTEARNHLLNIYQQYHPILSDLDRNNLNETRKRAVDVVLMLDLERVWNSEYLSLSNDIIGELSRTSVRLGQYHQQLLFSYVSALNTRITQIKGLSYGR